jgi:hypothetical protein
MTVVVLAARLPVPTTGQDTRADAVHVLQVLSRDVRPKCAAIAGSGIRWQRIVSARAAHRVLRALSSTAGYQYQWAQSNPLPSLLSGV